VCVCVCARLCDDDAVEKLDWHRKTKRPGHLIVLCGSRERHTGVRVFKTRKKKLFSPLFKNAPRHPHRCGRPSALRKRRLMRMIAARVVFFFLNLHAGHEYRDTDSDVMNLI
jgi:hypothetical protein